MYLSERALDRHILASISERLQMMRKRVPLRAVFLEGNLVKLLEEDKLVT